MTIFKSFLIALLFSSNIYFEYFDFQYIYLNSIISVFAIYFILKSSKKEFIQIGFFIGLLWFYWISFSFQYYDLNYLIPFIILFFGLLYGFLFYLFTLYESVFLKALALVTLSIIEIFGFNWFKVQILFVDTIFSSQTLFVTLFIFIIALAIFFKRNIILLALVLCISLPQEKSLPSVKIAMPQFNLDQEEKWKINNRQKITDLNFKEINNAIEQNYELIVLPETAFPFSLTQKKDVYERLISKSKDISILTGSLHKKNNQYFNASYLFEDGKVHIAHKTVLVPFGEAVPFPEMIRNLINDIFYDGAKDYAVASNPTTFTIQNTKFRNAICYEATTDKVFENIDTAYMIAISNNAWFTPSTQAALQKQLLKYYAKKYNAIIFHSSNGTPNAIIY